VRGTPSSVVCRDAENTSLTVVLWERGPWSAILLDEGRDGTLPARRGACTRQPSASYATVEAFHTPTVTGELYCYVYGDNVVFSWYTGHSRYVAEGTIELDDEIGPQLAYEHWERDRELVLGYAVPSHLFN
ncbi:MAG TPA: hypothetical protein VH081_06000, partial [Solirubrobacteraceae bacterium]|nr:hypothetical protein [Solirubrobacteraceae bacterium]